MAIIVMGIITSLALAFVCWPLVSPRRHIYFLDNMLGLGDQKTLAHLHAMRALAYDNLRDLQLEHEMGKLTVDDYSRLREGLLREAQDIVREIDVVMARREVDDLVETDARSRRRIP